jgi:hypothetical protein
MVAMVSRAAWGAGGSTAGRNVPLSSRRWIVLHWPGTAVGQDARAVVRSIDSFHRNTNRWAVIGYNYLVARDGTIFEGAGLMTRGIHSPPRNTDGFGICLLIGPGEQVPARMRDATRSLHSWLNGRAGRTLSRAGHRTHHATSCPGDIIYAWIRAGMPGGGGVVAPPPPPPAPGGVPAFPGRILRQPPVMRGEDVRTWQRQASRRWTIGVDGAYGPQSEGVCRQVQAAAGLAVDGRVGPNTWPATWRVTGGARGVGNVSSVAFWRGPQGGTEETHRVARRASDGRILYSRNGGPYREIAGTNARGDLDIASSPSGWLVISYANTGNRACELRSAPGGRPWAWFDMGVAV